jgi:hypothetical protein
MSFDRLPAVRDDFADCLDDIGDALAETVRHQIAMANSLRELWHLRAEMYRVIALQHNQWEAERRLAGLNVHFPTRSPRSGFAPL